MTFNFAGSQTLAGQLTSGAPADVYAPANARQMQAAIDAGRIEPADVRDFASNGLVIVIPRDNPASIGSPADLAAPDLKLVLADAAVPAGQYSRNSSTTHPAILLSLPWLRRRRAGERCFVRGECARCWPR